MTYDELVTRLAHQTGLHSDVVKRVLFYLPDVLCELSVGEAVRTPLGVFRMLQREARPITLPNGATTAVVSQKTAVKLKAGIRLAR